MKKQIDIFDKWINTFILSKTPLPNTQKVFIFVACIIILIGSANVFGKFLSLTNSIIILIIFFSFSAYIDYKLFIFPLLKYKEKNNKRLLSNRLFGIYSCYITYGLISWFSLSWFSHWTVLLLPLYSFACFSMWVKTEKESKKEHEYYVSIYGKDIVESSWNDDLKEVKKKKKNTNKKLK
jgi:hypothetical protein